MKMPEPLAPDEQKDLLSRFFETRDPMVGEVLVTRNLRLVGSIIRDKFNIPQDDVDDFVDIGAIGLIKAVDKFDPRKKTKFATYATKCVENEIRMFFRKGKNDPARTAASLDEPYLADGEGGEACLYDTTPSGQDVSSEVVDKVTRDGQLKLLSALIGKSLDDRERFILIRRYGLGTEKVTQRAVADMIGVSQSYVSRLERGIKNKLKKAAKNPS